MTPPSTSELLAEATRAAELRSHATNPAVVALAVDKARESVDRLMWVGITLGMAFTTVTVQQWAAGAATVGSIAWLSAWLLAPLVEVPLLAILRGEQVAARHKVKPGPWSRRARWVLLIAAYLMNTYGPWAAVLGSGAGWNSVLLHSVPVVAVLVGVEALTDLRSMLDSAVDRAGRDNRPSPRPKPAGATAARTVREAVAQQETASTPVDPDPTVQGADEAGLSKRDVGMAYARANPDATAKQIQLAAGVSRAESYRIRDLVKAAS